MRGLRGVTVLPGEKHVRIAAGENWASVYAKLEAHEPPLTTAGGRSRAVGATGFLLGGGLSFFSARVGFSADLVIAWEVTIVSLLFFIDSTSWTRFQVPTLVWRRLFYGLWRLPCLESV